GDKNFDAMVARLSESYRALVTRAQIAYAQGLPFNLDAWDGYPVARERLYAMLRRIGANPVAFAGDSHAAWANNLHDASGVRIGTEFGSTAITSPSYGS
ncbi:MAG: alkaline phosphatase D family protein, partial [Novosphingobium sp.]